MTRYLVDVSPPSIAPGDKGYLFTFDYLEYVSGPDWWPAIGILAPVGIVVGLIAGACYSLISGRFDTGGARAAVSALTAAAGGMCVGGCTYFYGRSVHPVVEFIAIIDGSYRGPSLASDSRTVPGAPWFFELSPPVVYLPLLGALIAVAVVVFFGLARRVLRREQR